MHASSSHFEQTSSEICPSRKRFCMSFNLRAMGLKTLAFCVDFDGLGSVSTSNLEPPFLFIASFNLRAMGLKTLTFCVEFDGLGSVSTSKLAPAFLFIAKPVTSDCDNFSLILRVRRIMSRLRCTKEILLFLASVSPECDATGMT